MRLVRVLALATGITALLAPSSAAQEGRQFKDSWFWGLKGGGLLYSSESTTSGGAPLVGAEWLITRTNGGLYLSFDQAFFSTRGGFVDRDADSVRSFVRAVNIENLRRFTVAGMIFPAQTRRIHPYAGLGLALNQVASAALALPIANARFALAQDSIQARKAAFTPIGIGGAQFRFKYFSAFAQATASPSQRGFFLSNNGSTSVNLSLEFGARYNIGSSIDRAR